MQGGGLPQGIYLLGWPNQLAPEAPKDAHLPQYEILLRMENERKKRRGPTAGEQKEQLRQKSMNDYVMATGAAGKVWDPKDARTQSGHEAVLRYVVRGMKPLSAVDRPELWQLLAHFQPCYRVPTRSTIRNMIEPEAFQMKERIRQQVTTGEWLSYTSDIWTDDTTKESFISPSAHWITGYWQRRDHVLACRHFPESHTAENIERIVNEIHTEWGLGLEEDDADFAVRKEVHNMIVRDGAANMRKGCNLIPMKNVHCAIHLLQLAVHDGCLAQTMPKRIIDKCRGLCTFLHQSARATAEFRKTQVSVYDIKISRAKQLVGDVKTRWNSTYLMLLRIQTLRQALIPFMQNEADLDTSAWTEAKSRDPND